MDIQVLLDAVPEILTQLVAFLLVLWVLKKYAFSTVFNILSERRKNIAASLDEADAKKKEMEALKKEYEQRLQGIEQEGRKKVLEAVNEGQRLAGQIREKARADAAAQTERAKEDIAREVQKARIEIRNEIVEVSTRMAGRLIGKNLSDEENRRFVEKTLDEA